MAGKVTSQLGIIRLVKALRRQGKRIVTFNGSFDVLHVGHVRALAEARRQGDVLMVLLNSDSSVRSYKGPQRPLVPEGERAELLAALEAVDYVVLFDEINPRKLLAKITPHIHCNGADWGKDCIERNVVEEGGGSRIHVLRWSKARSTSALVERIADAARMPTVHAVFLDRDGTINHRNTRGYVHRKEEFRFMPGALEALRALTKSASKIIIVTNQSGIGRGSFTARDAEILHGWLRTTLAAEGVRLDGIYYCPHRPEDRCACRKPEIGMLLCAAEDFGLSLSGSWIIGDDPRDVLTGREANVNTIKIAGPMPRGYKVQPQYVANDLREAVRIILGDDADISERNVSRRRSAATDDADISTEGRHVSVLSHSVPSSAEIPSQESQLHKPILDSRSSRE
ncbi:MAG: HAD-IIIA family hydrolase [Patescibacteria group bacterium]|nr:HAD-IIIA family hydrolase [Patescibacteria group bacterium]